MAVEAQTLDLSPAATGEPVSPIASFSGIGQLIDQPPVRQITVAELFTEADSLRFSNSELGIKYFDLRVEGKSKEEALEILSKGQDLAFLFQESVLGNEEFTEEIDIPVSGSFNGNSNNTAEPALQDDDIQDPEAIIPDTDNAVHSGVIDSISAPGIYSLFTRPRISRRGLFSHAAAVVASAGATWVGHQTGLIDRVTRQHDDNSSKPEKQDKNQNTNPWRIASIDQAQPEPSSRKLDKFAESPDSPEFEVSGWDVQLPEDDLLVYRKRYGTDDSEITLSIAYEFNEEDIVITPAPEIRITNFGITTMHGVETKKDNKGNTFYSIPGLKLGNAKLLTAITSEVGKTIEVHEDFNQDEIGAYPDVGPQFDMEKLLVLSNVEMPEITLHDIWDIGNAFNEYYANIWRVFVTGGTPNVKINVQGAETKNVLMITKDRFNENTPQLRQAGLFELTREATNLLLDPESRKYVAVSALMSKLQIMYNEDLEYDGSEIAPDTEGTRPQFLQVISAKSQLYSMEISDYNTVFADLYGYQDFDARDIMREFLPLARYMVPELIRNFRKVQNPDERLRLQEYMLTCLEILDTMNESEEASNMLLPQRKRLEESFSQIGDLTSDT